MASILKQLKLTLGERAYEQLKAIADAREVTVQELIRAVILPEWLNSFPKGRQPSEGAKPTGQP